MLTGDLSSRWFPFVRRPPLVTSTVCPMSDMVGELDDAELRSEIELVGDLVVAASQFDERVPEERIDEALGIERRSAHG